MHGSLDLCNDQNATASIQNPPSQVDSTLVCYLACCLVKIGINDVFSLPCDFKSSILPFSITSFLSLDSTTLAAAMRFWSTDMHERDVWVACVVAFTVGGFSVRDAIAGAYSENLPVICVVGGPNTDDYGTNWILHHCMILAWNFNTSKLLPAIRIEGKMPREEDESLIIYLKRELEASLVRNDSLEKENQGLRLEVVRLKAQITSLKAHDNERKSMLWKKLQSPIDTSKPDISHQKSSDFVKVSEQSTEYLGPRQNIQELSASKERPGKLPNPPPRPTSVVFPPLKEVNENKLSLSPAPPPPPPPPKMSMGSKSVRRVPEVVEFYRLLTRKDARMESRTNSAVNPVVAFSPNMIGEIENRSTYLSAIKSDVEKQKEFINFLIKEVDSAAFKDMAEVKVFVKWLDDELSSLVDERAVLKHFPQWPERKADALREAAFNYRDLRNLESEVSSFEDNPKERLTQALGRMQALQDRLERSVNNVERTRDSTTKRYRELQIPWEWLQNTGLIGQIKLSSLKLAKEYMKRIIKELQYNKSKEEDNLLLQVARFAYRIHQFAGGFDGEAIQAFQELKKVGMDNHKQ